MLTQKELKEILHYNPDTGILIWLKHKKSTEIGKIAGGLDHGYWRIRYKNKIYYAHRLVWLYMYGFMPDELDHINLIRNDNRLCNLRPATRTQQSANIRKKSFNKSGFKGVSWSKLSKSWRMDIRINGERFYSLHLTPEEAHEAYKLAAIKAHGEFARTD